MNKQNSPLNGHEYENDDESFAGSATDWGYGPDDYEETMGLKEDADWEDNFDFDNFGEADD